jgi:hypothetical protein
MNRNTASPMGDHAGLRTIVGLIALVFGAPIFAGFLSTETFLPAVGRVPGQNGAQFYTTVWATNLTGLTVNFTFDFLKEGQANVTPASFADTLAPGETKVYENVVETKLGLNNALGAARVTSSGEILVAERIYNQQPGDDLGKTEGLFFAGVPKAFSISLGQSASIQGINQGGSENFRYNFALVETGGASTTVHVTLIDNLGATLGSRDYVLQPYEQLQPNVTDLFAGIATTNARIAATVTSGSGSVLIAGAQLANESQDSSGFEMSFRDDILGGGLGTGLTAVAHDGTLVGNGTVGTPLGVNPAAVVTSLNGLHGAVTLSGGSNVSLTPSGQTITIAASGGGGLALPYTASLSSTQTLFTLFNTGSGGAISGSVTGAGAFGVYGNSDNGVGVYGTSGSGYGVTGSSGSGGGVQGTSGVTNFPGIDGINNANGDGVFGISTTGTGVHGVSGSSSSAIGVNGTSTNGTGVNGSSSTGHGVTGQSSATGVNGSAIWANSTTSNGIALFATNNGNDATIVATNGSTGDIYKGFANGGTLVFEVTGSGQVHATSSLGVALAAQNSGTDATILATNTSGGDLFVGYSGGTVFEVTGAGNVKAHGSISPNSLDYADRLPSERGLEPGDVVAIGPDGLLRETTRANDTTVAGVYSTKPGVEGHNEAERRPTVPVALAGMIPVKVSAENGPIRAGDLLVSSSRPGRAMRAPAVPAPGTVLGKAMQSLTSGDGTVQMLVMLR